MQTDPQERDPRLGPLIRAAHRQARADLGPLTQAMGSCYVVWARQQEILATEHGIRWQSPADLNPGIIWD